MKFNFEKHIGEEPKQEPKQEKSELTQEQFDEQIIQEADKLGANLQQLKEEIDQLGGPDKFKEIFEKPDTTHFDNKGRWSPIEKDTNSAGIKLGNLFRREKLVKRDAKNEAIWGTVIALGTLLAEYGILVIPENSSDGMVIATMVLTLIAGGSGAVYKLTGSFRDRVKARKINREKKTEELKFKMTGTEVK